MASPRGAYRGVYCSLVDSLDFQRLSARARHVFLTARLSPQAGPACIFRYYPAVIAEQTGLLLREVDSAVNELVESGWAQLEDGIMWLINALRYDPTIRLAHPKQRIAVERTIQALPVRPIVLRFCDYYKLESLSKSLVDSFTALDRHVHVQVHVQVPGSGAGTGPETETEKQLELAPRSAGAEAWEAYAGAYKRRYGVQPVRNAKVNGQMALLAKRLPESDLGAVAAFYVAHGGARYVAAGHPVGLLLYDAEKLHMEWATGRRITETGARHADQRAERGGIAERLIAKAQQDS